MEVWGGGTNTARSNEKAKIRIKAACDKLNISVRDGVISFAEQRRSAVLLLKFVVPEIILELDTFSSEYAID